MIVSVCNEKGGSGKSTLAINIAINQGLNLSEIEKAEENSIIKICKLSYEMRILGQRKKSETSA